MIIGNIGGQYPPTDAAAFEQRLAVVIGLYLPTLLQDARPLDDPRGYRIPVCVRHHFEQMEIGPMVSWSWETPSAILTPSTGKV